MSPRSHTCPQLKTICLEKMCLEFQLETLQMPQKGSKWFTDHYKVEKKKKKTDWLSGKESARQCRIRGLDPWVRKIPWSRKWQPTLISLPRKSHRGDGWATVHGVAEELDMTSQQTVTKTKIELKRKENKFHLGLPLSPTLKFIYFIGGCMIICFQEN